MSLHRRNPKRDENERIIVDALEACGFCVDRVSAAGFPDLVVSKWGKAWFLECKQPKGTFTKAQQSWRKRWQGPDVQTVRSVEDAQAFTRKVTLG